MSIPQRGGRNKNVDPDAFGDPVFNLKQFLRNGVIKSVSSKTNFPDYLLHKPIKLDEQGNKIIVLGD